MGYNSIAWLPLCAGLTVLGLVLSYLVGRRRGVRSFLRGAAWSLLPIAAYLTGSVEMFWKIGAAIGHYADGFVFSPVKWAGVAVAGFAALLFFATSGRERRRAARLARRDSGDKPERVTGESGTRAIATPAAAQPRVSSPDSRDKVSSKGKPGSKDKAKSAAPDDDLSDVEAILRKRGI